MDVNFRLSSQPGGATGRHQVVASSVARSPSDHGIPSTTRFYVPADPHIKAEELVLDRSYRQVQWGASTPAVGSRASSGSDAVSATQHVWTSPVDTEHSSKEGDVLAGLTYSHLYSYQYNLVGNAAGSAQAASGDMDRRGPVVGYSAVDKQHYSESYSAAAPAYSVHGRFVGNQGPGAAFGASYVPAVVPASIKSTAAHLGSPWELLLYSWMASQSAVQHRLSRYSMQSSRVAHSDFQLSAAGRQGNGSYRTLPPFIAGDTSNAAGNAALAPAGASLSSSSLLQHGTHVGGTNQRDNAGMRSVPSMSGVAGGPFSTRGPGSISRYIGTEERHSKVAGSAAMRQGRDNQRDALPQKRPRPADCSTAVGSLDPHRDLPSRFAQTSNIYHCRYMGGRYSREQLLAAETLALGLSQDLRWKAPASAGTSSAPLHQGQGRGVADSSSFGRGYSRSLDQREMYGYYIQGHAALGISPAPSIGPPPMTAREQAWVQMKQQEWMRQRHQLASHGQGGVGSVQQARLTHGQMQQQQQLHHQWQQHQQQQQQQQQLHEWQQQQQRRRLWLMQQMQLRGPLGPVPGAEYPVRASQSLGMPSGAGRRDDGHTGRDHGQRHGRSGGDGRHRYFEQQQGQGQGLGQGQGQGQGHIAAVGRLPWSGTPAVGSSGAVVHRSGNGGGDSLTASAHTSHFRGAVGASTEQPSNASAAAGLPADSQAGSVGESAGGWPLRGARKAAQSGVLARRRQERSGLELGDGLEGDGDRVGSSSNSGKELGAPPAASLGAATDHGLPDSAQQNSFRDTERSKGGDASRDRGRGAGEVERRLGAVEAAGAIKSKQSSTASSSSSSRSSSSSSSASANASSSEAEVPQPASWSRESTKSKWFAIVMNSTRGGKDRARVRREKQAIIRRLFDDFEFAEQCSLELLRRGAEGTVDVVDPSASLQSPAKMTSTGRPAVRLLRGFKYSDMEEWTESMTRGCWEVRAQDQPAVPQLNQGKAAPRAAASSDEQGTLPFVPPDPAGRQVRGYQLYIVFRPVGAIARRPKQYRTPVQRGVSVAKLLRGGTERRTSICAKLRSVTSPDPNGNEAVLQWVDELLDYKVI